MAIGSTWFRRILLCSLPLVSACGDPGLVSSELQSAGEAVVHPAVPFSARSRELPLLEDLVLGAESGDLNHILTIDGLAVGPEGRMFVLEARAREVRVFDADGMFLETLGGQGEGPGEISGRPMGIAIAADNLVVYDVGAWLFHVWTTDGNFIERHRLSGLLSAHQFTGTERGTILFAGNLLGAVGGVGGDPNRWRLQEIALDGDLVHDLAATDPVAPTVSVGDKTLTLYMKQGRSPQAALGLRDEIVYWSAMDDYEVAAVTFAGEERWRLRVPWPRETIPAAVKHEALAASRRFAPTASVSDVTWPDFLPALSMIATDGAGRLYVVPRVPGLDPDSPTVALDVYSADGELLFVGKVRRLSAGAEASERWLAARDGYIYTRRESPSGIQLVRYRVDESVFNVPR